MQVEISTSRLPVANFCSDPFLSYSILSWGLAITNNVPKLMTSCINANDQLNLELGNRPFAIWDRPKGPGRILNR